MGCLGARDVVTIAQYEHLLYNPLCYSRKKSTVAIVECERILSNKRICCCHENPEAQVQITVLSSADSSFQNLVNVDLGLFVFD